jgi:hypothetical protein
VLDPTQGTIRRFLGHGAKELSREFEMVDDQQHWVVLEVTDTAGKKALSTDIKVYSYKADLFRCGDNCNILGGARFRARHQRRDSRLRNALLPAR